MMTVDRDEFRAWARGVLLERDAAGHVMAPQERRCEAAEAALLRGETVQLTRRDRVVSTMRLVGGQMQEAAA